MPEFRFLSDPSNPGKGTNYSKKIKNKQKNPYISPWGKMTPSAFSCLFITHALHISIFDVLGYRLSCLVPTKTKCLLIKLGFFSCEPSLLPHCQQHPMELSHIRWKHALVCSVTTNPHSSHMTISIHPCFLVSNLFRQFLCQPVPNPHSKHMKSLI